MMRIVVLAGGISSEREVSIVSGRMICKALRESGHRAILLDAFCGNRITNAVSEDCFLKTCSLEELFPKIYDVEAEVAYIKNCNIEEIKKTRKKFWGPWVLEICERSDIVFMALHGEAGENGKVQATFDLLGIPYTGCGVLGSAVAMDKEISRKVLSSSNVPVVNGISFGIKDEKKKTYDNSIGLPCVVKPCCGGSSIGVRIAYTEEEYEEAIEEAFRYDAKVVVEEYIEGREFSVGVVDGEVYPIIEIKPLVGFFDYNNKYQEGATIETCPAEIDLVKTSEIKEYAKRVYNALKLERYARIDFVMREDGIVYCLEANTLPGMTPTSLLPKEAEVLGKKFSEFCELLVKISIH